ncbi:MAG TPA: pitrilysin family protein, partial [Candidatus Limnocylindrales bacterium]|nr:pitrilysin family protein [Candidatus Limnocylindrales bacterium]
MKHTVSEASFKNGLKGLIIHIPNAQVMTFDLNFRAGEYLVEEHKWEVPHLMEHILLGANKHYPRARDFQAEIEKNGAYSNASTSVYDITYEAECADFEWERILDLLMISITEPLFLREEYQAEFGNVREELTARANNHFRHLSLALRESYGFLAKTDQERLRLMKNVKLKDIREHYESTHTSSNMRFVISGNITPKRRETIEARLASIGLPDGNGRIELPDERPKRLERPLHIDNPTVKNIYFYIDTFMRRRLTDAELDALNLSNTMLTETLHSKILGAARERGLVYGMSSGVGQAKLNSNWWFGAQVSPKNAAALFEIIVTELEKIFAGDLERADIEAAQQYALGRFQRGAQTVSGTASGYSGRYFFDESIDDYYQVPKRIQAITKESIVSVARELFKEQLWGFGSLGSCGEDYTASLQSHIEG